MRAVMCVFAVVSMLAAAPGAVAHAATPVEISHARVLAIALRVAKTDGEDRPRHVRAARGTLARALKVITIHRTRPPSAPAGGPGAPGGPQSPVYLVAMS